MRKGTEASIDLSALAQRGEVTSFRQVRDVKRLPESVVHQFQDGLARPSENFQATDVVRDGRLPVRRLVFAGLARDYCIVHFERGGIANAFYIVLFRLSDNTASTV
jgi:nicotinamidase-related amidase